MGKLLNAAIAGSKAAAAAPVLNLYSELGTAITNRARWSKNGVLVGTFTGTSSFTLVAGDTFSWNGNNTVDGFNWIVQKNGVTIDSGSAFNYTSPTYTVANNETYNVNVYLGF